MTFWDFLANYGLIIIIVIAIFWESMIEGIVSIIRTIKEK